jgi:hypothetical protein
LGLS